MSSVNYGMLPSRFAATLLGVGLGMWWLRVNRQRRMRRLPKRLVLIRHGQSEGNATSETKAAYRSTPDHRIPLTERGRTEARRTGKLLKVLLSRGRAKIFCSPHVRARQTLQGVLEAISPELLLGETTFDELLRELDRGFFGQPFSSVAKFAEARKKEGWNHFRFPGHDSLLDVGQRVAVFWSLLRNFLQGGHLRREDTVVLVAHNGSLGQLLGRLLGWSTERTGSARLPNACLFVLERFEFPTENSTHPYAALYAPTASTYRHLGDLAALGLNSAKKASDDITDAEFDARFGDAARKAALRLFEGLHPSMLV